jgi:hypothetical protein
LYIADNGNDRIRKVTYPPILTVPTISLSGIVSTPVGSTVTVTATVANAGSSYLIHWLNHGTEFTTTTIPSVTYTKGIGIDTITARVVSTATYGCYDSTTSAGHVVSDASEGTSPGEREVLRTYPNPAGTSFTVFSSGKIKGISISNLIGQTVFTQAYVIEKAEVNISGLPQGVYIVRVTDSEGRVMITKIVKE